MTRALVAALMTAGLAGGAAAEEVAVPLRIDLASVREALVAQIFTEPGGEGEGVARRHRLRLARALGAGRGRRRRVAPHRRTR